MIPLAFASQRAFPPRRTDAKQTQQETSWPRLLKAKASVRSLTSKSSFTSLTRRGVPQSSTSPKSPQSPAMMSPAGETPPPVPPIPSRYVMGSTAAANQESPSEAIAPFLAFENLAPAKKPPTTPKTPTTPTSNKMRNFRAFGSTTTVNTTPTTPSREFSSIPDDPLWDDAVKRVRRRVRRDQEEEHRERNATIKAERRYIRNVSKGREGHLKWAKTAIDALIGKYDEHGWLPKKDPKDFDDDDWKFVLDVLDHEDTKKLRDRLFQKPEWAEADKARRLRYEEAMRINPTPEFLAAQKAQRDKERKEYGFRKMLGMLTEEEQERERLGESPPVGLGITNPLIPLTPQSTHTSKSSKATGQSSQSSSTFQTASRGRSVKRIDHGTPSRLKDVDGGNPSLARDSVEQMTGVFNTEGFNPRLSRLGSEEVRQYIREKSSTRAELPAPAPIRSHVHTSLDPRQRSNIPFTQGSRIPTQQSQAVKKVASENNLLRGFATKERHTPITGVPSPTLPTLGVHPALRDFRDFQASTAPIPVASRIPRFRKVSSSIAPSDLQQPKIRKPPSAVKASSEPTPSPSSSLPQPSSRLGRVKPSGTPKTAPIIRKPPTKFNATRSASDPAHHLIPVRQQGPPTRIFENVENTNAGLAKPRDRPHSPQNDAGSKRPCDGKSDNAEYSEQLYTTSWDAPEDDDDLAPFNEKILANPTYIDQRRTSSLPLFEPNPKSLARLSRIPTMPDASDFQAAMGDDSDIPRDTTSSSLTSITPGERLTAKRSGIPVAFGSNARANQEPIVKDFSAIPQTSSPPIIRVNYEPSTPGGTTMPLQASSSGGARIATGKWEVVPPATQHAASNTAVSPSEDARCHIEHVEDLMQLTPTKQPLVPLDKSHMPRQVSPMETHMMNVRGQEASNHGMYRSFSDNVPSSPNVNMMNMRGTEASNDGMYRSFSENVPSMPNIHTMNIRGPEASNDGIYRSFSENVPSTPNVAYASERSVSLGNDEGDDAGEVDVSFEDVINAWQQSSPLPSAQSHNSLGSFNSQETQILRSELGLEPIREHIPGNAKHPKHHYTWNTKKIMCRRIHNPGIVLPSLPSPAPGRPAHMAEYASEFFMGNPYTNEPSKPERCTACGSFCCQFAELSCRPQKRTTDIMELNKIRLNAEAVASLRARKPNGVEEWDAFLECSQCRRDFCPDCIMLCSEDLCQEPVCADCREGLELCRIHNVF